MATARSAPRSAIGTDVLDRIDAIVAPGTTLAPGDAGWEPPALADAGRRRRHRDA